MSHRSSDNQSETDTGPSLKVDTAPPPSDVGGPMYSAIDRSSYSEVDTPLAVGPGGPLNIDLSSAHRVSSPNISGMEMTPPAHSSFVNGMHSANYHFGPSAEISSRKDLMSKRCVDKFTCGVGCFCGLSKTWTHFDLTFHISALITIVFFAAFTVGFNIGYHDELHIISTPLWRYFLAISCVIAIAYVGVLVQAVLEWLVGELLSTTPFQDFYFWAASIASTTSLLAVSISALVAWNHVLTGIDTESHGVAFRRIDMWLNFVLICTISLVIRKYLIFSAMYYFNRSKYLKRAAKIKLQEQIVLDLCGKEALIDDSDSKDSLLKFAKLLRFFAGEQSETVSLSQAQRKARERRDTVNSIAAGGAPIPSNLTEEAMRPAASPLRTHATFRASITKGLWGVLTGAKSESPAAALDAAAAAATKPAGDVASSSKPTEAAKSAEPVSAPRFSYDLLEADVDPVGLQREIGERGFQNMNGGPHRFTITRNHGTVSKSDIIAQAVANRIMAVLDKNARGYITARPAAALHQDHCG